MALVRDWSTAQLAFEVAGGDVSRFSVIRYRGTEGLCRLYRFEMELVSTDDVVPFDEIVGKPAVLSINTEGGGRWFHGVVGSFEAIGETVGQNYYRVELVPNLWLLTHRYSSRIFQGKTVVEIITDVLSQSGMASDCFDLGGLTGAYEPRDYCVQYRETDYNFICRLMEEEGIWWHFEQTEERHTLVLGDATGAYAPIEGDAALPYHPPSGMNPGTEHVFRFRLGQSVRPGKVVLNDYSFQRPALNLESTSDAGRDTGLEFSDYPGEYVEQSAGGSRAQLRIEEFEAARIHGTGQSSATRLGPGKTFELVEHPNEPLNRSYLLTSVSHEGRQSTARTVADPSGANGSSDRTTHRTNTEWLYHGGQVSRDLAGVASASGADPVGALAVPNLLEDAASSDVADERFTVYQCCFECIPSEVAYRPPRVTPWPVMRGAQTARVVGPESEEIYTDEFGRVKVHFNWDRVGDFGETDSCWIRVSQGMAGGQYGIMFLPRVGQEVIVDFLEGDPDKPIITGRVFNKDHMPPYALPDEKTKSVIKTRSTKGGGGTNEIRFEDLKDSEQVLLYAQKDLHVRVNNDRVENIGHDRHLTVKENKSELVKQGKSVEVKLDLKEKVGGDKSLDVAGAVSEKFGGNLSLDVTGDVIETFGKNHKNETTMTSATKALSIKLEATTGIELKCGGSSIVLTPAAIFIMGGPIVNINSGAGPPVGPVVALAGSPAAPAAPVDADSAEPGHDTTYAGGAEPEPAEVPADIKGHKVETTWIEVELVDEAGQPVVGEVVKVTDPGGEVLCERPTGANGIVHVLVPKEGTCQMSFVNLDAEAWERL